MTQSERFEYISNLEQKQHHRSLMCELEQAKRASKQQQIAFMSSFLSAQTANLLLASIGLCKRNGDD